RARAVRLTSPVTRRMLRKGNIGGGRVREQSMTSSRVALAADDPRLAGSIQTHLKKSLGEGPVGTTLAAVRSHLTHSTDGLLLLGATSPVEAEQVLRLVQEIYLQKWPPTLLVIEASPPGPGRGLAGLDPYVAGRLRWPDDADALAEAVRQRRGHGRPFALPAAGLRPVIRPRPPRPHP